PNVRDGGQPHDPLKHDDAVSSQRELTASRSRTSPASWVYFFWRLNVTSSLASPAFVFHSVGRALASLTRQQNLNVSRSTRTMAKTVEPLSWPSRCKKSTASGDFTGSAILRMPHSALMCSSSSTHMLTHLSPTIVMDERLSMPGSF